MLQRLQGVIEQVQSNKAEVDRAMAEARKHETVEQGPPLQRGFFQGLFGIA